METPEAARMTRQLVSNHQIAGGGPGTRLHIVPRRVGARQGAPPSV